MPFQTTIRQIAERLRCVALDARDEFRHEGENAGHRLLLEGDAMIEALGELTDEELETIRRSRPTG